MILGIFVPLCQFQIYIHLKVIGVMSGSSLDGIDIVLTSFEGSDWSLIASHTFNIPPVLRDRLRTSVQQTAFELAKTESLYSEFIATCINKFREEREVHLVGIHGHTVLHLPDLKTSWQLLNGGMIASLTMLPVSCDFRNQDMALGGQGTPMAVIADRDLYPGHQYYVNLGGIANISYKSNDLWVAYDLCACNQLLNYYSLKLDMEYDSGGGIARTGKLNQELLQLLHSDAYLKMTPPKSLDNSYIQTELINKIEVLGLPPSEYLRTITEFISEVISSSLEGSGGRLFVSGGGSKNDYLIELIEEKLQAKNTAVYVPPVETVDYKEAILISYCAYLRMRGENNFISEATGASADVCGGAIYLPPFSTI